MRVISNISGKKINGSLENAKKSKAITEKFSQKLGEILEGCQNIIGLEYNISQVELKGRNRVENVEVLYQKNRRRGRTNISKKRTFSVREVLKHTRQSLPVLVTKEAADMSEFVTFWSRLYKVEDEDLYNNNIQEEQFTKDNIQELYTWKNMMTLAQSKQKSLDEKIKIHLDIINQLKKQDKIDMNLFNATFGHISAVWKIFLLHIIKPTEFPIYDQHVHRAYCFIKGIKYSSISNKMHNKDKEDFYFNTYLEFVHSIEGINLKKLDEAFFAFGQFLNTKGNKNLLE